MHLFITYALMSLHSFWPVSELGKEVIFNLMIILPVTYILMLICSGSVGKMQTIETQGKCGLWDILCGW